MLNKAIDMINEQSKGYKKHSNEWGITNQLIDILTVSDDHTAEIVFQDLAVSEMNIGALVSKITKQRMTDPVAVMNGICKFYCIKAPNELSPEAWRNKAPQSPAPKPSSFSLLDFI